MTGSALFIALGVVLYSSGAIAVGYVIYRKTFRKRMYPDGLPPAAQAFQRRFLLYLLAYLGILITIGVGIALATGDWVAGVGVALGVMVILPWVVTAIAQSKGKREARDRG